MKPLDLSDLRFKYRNKFYNIVPIHDTKKIVILLEGYIKTHPQDTIKCIEITSVEWDTGENVSWPAGWYADTVCVDIKRLQELLETSYNGGSLVRKGSLAYKALNQWWKYKYKNNLYKDQK